MSAKKKTKKLKYKIPGVDEKTSERMAASLLECQTSPGRFSASVLAEKSKRKSHPYHDRIWFCADDDAAWAYRVMLARRELRKVVIERVDEESGATLRRRALQNVRVYRDNPGVDQSYADVDEIAETVDERLHTLDYRTKIILSHLQALADVGWFDEHPELGKIAETLREIRAAHDLE